MGADEMERLVGRALTPPACAALRATITTSAELDRETADSINMDNQATIQGFGAIKKLVTVLDAHVKAGMPRGGAEQDRASAIFAATDLLCALVMDGKIAGSDGRNISAKQEAAGYGALRLLVEVVKVCAMGGGAGDASDSNTARRNVTCTVLSST